MRDTEAVEHGVGGGHGRQRHVEAVRPARSHQPMGEHQRRFRLSAPGLVLDHEEGRAGRQLDRTRPLLHGTQDGRRVDQYVVVHSIAGVGREHARLFDGAVRSFPRMIPVASEVLEGFRLAIGKPLLVGADPVGQYGETRQGVGRRAYPFTAERGHIRWNAEQIVRLADELPRRLDSGSAEIAPQRGDALPSGRVRGRSVMSGHRGYQGAPRTMPRSVRQLEEVVFGIEQAQPARAVIVEA